MSVNFDNSKPIYLQLMEYYFQKICSGQLMPGEKLPSVRETAVEVGVNPNTVQRTYAEMERKGVVVSKRGQGSFVTEEKQMIQALRGEISQQQVNTFIEYMHNNGFSNEEIIQQVTAALQNGVGMGGE